MDKKSLVFRGYPPIHCCCDATFRRLPNGQPVVFFMTGGGFEPEPANFIALSRSDDEGATWNEFEVIHRSAACEADLFGKTPHYFDPNWRDRLVPNIATTLSEVVVEPHQITVYAQIHDGHFGHWNTVTIKSEDNGLTWGEPELFEPLPHRTMIRNLYRTSWGEYILPYQFYPPVGEMEVSPFVDRSITTPKNGVLIAPTPSGPWMAAERLDGPAGWAEVNVAELSSGTLVMLARTDEGVLWRTESTDKGRTWSPYVPSDIPNPGSKFRLFKLPDGRIALLHNPNGEPNKPTAILRCPINRTPLALWISDDDMKTWGYQRVLLDIPGAIEYPDGELSADGRTLHFAFDYNRHDVLYWEVELP